MTRREKFIAWLEIEGNLEYTRKTVSAWNNELSLSKSWERLIYVVDSMVQSDDFIDQLKNYYNLDNIHRRAADFITGCFLDVILRNEG